MGYILSEEDFNKYLTPAEHKARCEEHERKISSLKEKLGKLKSLCIEPVETNKSLANEMKRLLEFAEVNSRRYVMNHVEKHGGLISDIGCAILFYDNAKEERSGFMTSIDSNGHIETDDGESTHINKLTSDSLFMLIEYLNE